MEVLSSPPVNDGANVEPGVHPARLARVVSFSNSYGPRIGFVFALDGEQTPGVTITRATSPRLSEASKLAETIEGLTGQKLTASQIEEGIDFDDLVGLRCRLLVLPGQNKSGKMFANVERVFQ